MAFNSVVIVYPARHCLDYVSVKRRDINVSPFAVNAKFFFQRCVNGFPARRLLWADPTSKASSLTLLSAWLPYPLPWEQLWISQVPATTLYTCHGLITPLVRYNLARKKNRLLRMDFDGVTSLVN